MVQTPVQIKAVTTRSDQQAFLELPAFIYKDDPHWVPPFTSSVAKNFAAENPFFEYGQLQQFIALEGDQTVGRIVAAINRRLIERENQKIGLFGFFESVANPAVASALIEAAGDWLRDRGMTQIRGPINLSTHNGCFFLIDGFDSPPRVMMPYNPPYYGDLMEQVGLHKAKDSYAYNWLLDEESYGKFERGYHIAQKSGVTFRSLRVKGEGFEQDCRDLYQLFTTAFSDNWSSTPRTEAEFLAEAQELKAIVDPDIFIIAEDQGRMVGLFMGLPDANLPLKRSMKNGKLKGLGLLKFLWYKRRIDQARVVAICSLPEYRRKMVPIAVIYLGMKGGLMNGKRYKRAELSWVFEDNMASRKLIESGGAEIYKTYRIYEKAL